MPKDISVHYGTMRDNPHLPAGAVSDFENDPSFGEAERQARLYGKFESLTSRVWPQFYRGAPYTEEPAGIPREWERLHVVDPHSARPWAMLWAARDPFGWWHIYREWPEEDFTKLKTADTTFGQYAQIIRNLEGKEQVKWRVIDPNYGVQRRSRAGFKDRSIQEEMSDYGINFDPGVDDNLERGVGVVADLLTYDTRRPIGPDNGPGIIVQSHCTNTIAAFLNVSWLDSKNAMRRSEKMSEEFKDFADCVRYLAVYDLPEIGTSFQYTEGFGTLEEEE